MGNVLAQPIRASADLLGDLQPSNVLVLRDTLGGGRFQKTLLCVHDEGGLVVVKVYQKRADTPPLDQIRAQLLRIRAALTGLPRCHVWPWQTWLDTPNSAYLLRQHLACSLYDRLSTRPFLSRIEKRWIAFQLLQALAQAHEAGVCHGDLKAENVLLTSWHWLFLVDWAPYKPVMLPEDNPADFSFYFDTGGRRRCYIAPERFYATTLPQPPAGSAGNPGVGGVAPGSSTAGTAGGAAAAAADAPAAAFASLTEGGSAAPRLATALTPEMDVFTAGCVLAELFLDGRALFDLGSLLGYKRNQWDPNVQGPLQSIEPPELRALITHMIQLEPAMRWSARQYLTEWQPGLFPSYFAEVLHPFFDSLLPLDTDARIAATAAVLPTIKEAVRAAEEEEAAQRSATAAAAAAAQAEAANPQDGGAAPGEGQAQDDARRQLSEAMGTMGSGPLLSPVSSAAGGPTSPQLAASPTGPSLQPATATQQQQATPGGAGFQGVSPVADGMVLVVVLLCSLLRGARLVESKRAAVQMLTDVALLCDEDVRLQCCVPWLVTLLGDACASVRCLVLSCLVRLMDSLQAIPLSDAKVFQDYLLPALSLLPHDQEEMVRCEYAAGIAHLAEAAHRHVMRLQSTANAVTLRAAAAAAKLQEVAATSSVQPSPTRSSPAISATTTEAGATGKGPDSPSTRATPLGALQPRSSTSGAATAAGMAASAGPVSGDLPSPAVGGTDAAASDQQGVMGSIKAGAAALLDPSTASTPPDRTTAQDRDREGGGTPLTSPVSPSLAVVAAAAVGLAEASGFRAEAELASLRGVVEKVVLDLVTGARSSPAVKRSLLANAGLLAVFYGRRELNNTLLPLIITCLNAQEWQLRSAFFQAVAAIGPHTGRESLDVFLLPCLEQALADGEVSVVCDAVRCVTSVASHLRKRSLLQAAKKITALTEHSSTAVRSAAIAFIAAAARALPVADVVAQLSPLLAPPGRLLHPTTLRDPALLAEYLQTYTSHGADEEGDEEGSTNGGEGGEGQDSDDDPIMAMGTLSRPIDTLPGPTYPRLQIGGPLGAILEQPSATPTDGQHGTDGAAATGMRVPKSKSAAAKLAGPAAEVRGGGMASLRAGFGMRSLQHARTAPLRAGQLGSMSMGGRTGLTSWLGTQAGGVQGLEIEMTAHGMVMHPTAPVYLVELPDTPAPVIQAAALTDANDPSQHVSASMPVPQVGATMAAAAQPSPGTSPAIAAQGVLGMETSPGTAATAASASAKPRSMALMSRPRGGVLDEAVGLLQPATSLQRAAVASIQARVAALEAWVSASMERLMRDPAAASEAVDRQQLERAMALLGRLHGVSMYDIRSPSTLTTFKLAQLACRILPSPNTNSANRPSGTVSAAGGSRLQAPLGYALTGPTPETSDLGLAGFAVSDAVTAAMSTKLGTHGNSSSPSLIASLANLTLSSLRSSLEPSHVLAAAGGGTGGGYVGPGGVMGMDTGGAGATIWRPRGVLVSHLMEHRRAVTRIAVAKNNGFAVTTSLDETAKVWDIRRLDRDATFRSRLTYAAQAGSLTSCAAVEDEASIATGSSAGSVHVWRVEAASGTSGGIVGKRQLSPHMGSVLDVSAWGPHTLCYLTQHGGVHAWDLRVKQDVWRLNPPPSQGLVEHMALEAVGPSGGACGWGATGSWLVTGSSRGWLTVWDVRFLLPAHAWQHPMRCSIDAMALAAAPAHRLGVQAVGDTGGAATSTVTGASVGPAGGGAAGPLLYVAAGHQEVALWDVTSACVSQVLRCIGPHELGPTQASSSSSGGVPGSGSGSIGSHAAAPSPPLPGALQPHLSTSTAWLHDPQSNSLHEGSLGGAGGMDGMEGHLGGGSGTGGLQSNYRRADASVNADGSVDVLGVARLAQPTPRPPGARALLPLHSGLLLTGSTDRCIRCWDGAKPDSSYLVAGPLWSASDSLSDAQAGPLGLAIPQYKYSYRGSLMQGVPVLEERCSLEVVARFTESSQEIRQMMRVHDQCHGDALTHMAAADGLQGGRLLLTAARDGSLKVWR